MSRVVEDTLRNRTATRLANLALRLAERRFRVMVGVAIAYGLNAAAADHRAGRQAPEMVEVDAYDHPGLRNKVARDLSNAALRLGGEDYAAFNRGAIRYGLSAMVADSLAGNEPPPDWRTTS